MKSFDEKPVKKDEEVIQEKPNEKAFETVQETVENTDPIILRFKKMLLVGVPKIAVQQKMESEGCNETQIQTVLQ